MFFWRKGRETFIGLACIAWLAAALAAHAEVQQARDPIFDTRTQSLLESVQSAGTDLPMSLSSGRDIYLFVTAGASYTEIKALALPSVPAATLAQALDGATRGTILAGHLVTWSADDYSAAALTVSHGHVFGLASSNTVPVGPLIAGMRRAGFVPHCLLRIPVYASATGLPPPCRPPNHWRWYDQAQSASLGTVSVHAKLSPADAALPIVFVAFAIALSIFGLWMALRIMRDERIPANERRLRSTRWTMLSFYLTLPMDMTAMVFYERSLHGLAVADIWFGSGSVAALIPIFMVGLPIPVFTLPFTLRARRKYLPAVDAPVQTAMTPQEKAIRQRMARWTMVPHLLLALVIIAGPLLLPHNSAYYRILHPMSLLIAGFGTMFIGWLFKKPLSAFTRVAVDDDLTWRARQLGAQLGVRVQDVKVEDSTAASVYAQVSSEAGWHLKVSRKLVELLSPEEMDYVLANEIALMKVKASKWPFSWMMLSFAPILLLPIGLTRMMSGHAPLYVYNLI